MSSHTTVLCGWLDKELINLYICDVCTCCLSFKCRKDMVSHLGLSSDNLINKAPGGGYQVLNGRKDRTITVSRLYGILMSGMGRGSSPRDSNWSPISSRSESTRRFTTDQSHYESDNLSLGIFTLPHPSPLLDYRATSV